MKYILKFFFIVSLLFLVACRQPSLEEDLNDNDFNDQDPVLTCEDNPMLEGCEDYPADCSEYPNHPTCEVDIPVPDEAPSILLHETEITLNYGEPLPDFTNFVDAFDALNVPIDITMDMFDLTAVQTAFFGRYPITITVEDDYGNVAIETLFVNIVRLYVEIFPEEDIDDGVIYYIMINDLSPRYGYYTAARAIQGIVNRNQPNLMIINPQNTYYHHTDLTWKSYIEDHNYQMIRLHSYLELVYTFSDYFEYAIEIDDQIKSYNNWVSTDADFGAMMTAVTGYLPVPRGLLSSVYQYTGIPLIESFELNDIPINGQTYTFLSEQALDTPYKIYDYTFENFRCYFNKKSYMSLTSEAMDYAVQQKMMFFDLKPTYEDLDRDLFTRINTYFGDINDFFNLYGWVDQESQGLQFLKRYGGMIRVVGTGNLSLYAAIEIDYIFEQKAEYITDYNPNKKYITFIASEGDTIKAPTTFQQGAWMDEGRGLVPINWGLIANTTELFPIVAKYFYETATVNDYFFSGGASSLGFVDIDTQMPHEAMLAIAAENKRILAYSDQQYVDTYNDLYTIFDTMDPDYWGEYLILSGYKGAFGINPWESSGPIYMGDMLFYNRRQVFYPRAAYSPHVKLSALVRHNENLYSQPTHSNYWYIHTSLTRDANHRVTVDLFVQPNGDRYEVEIFSGEISLFKIINNERTLMGIAYTSMLGVRDLRISIDYSSSIMDAATITVYTDKTRRIQVDDDTFEGGGFRLYSENGVTNTFIDLKGKHLSQADEIYNLILNDPRQFIVGYYGVIWARDFTESQYRVEPGPGEVISMYPTAFYKIKVRLEDEFPGEYVIVNMDEFYEYLTISEGAE